MSIPEILNTTTHRPWQMPTGNWKYYQEWNRALFFHWQVDLQELQKFVPKELEIDLFEGKPWVSLVAFTMENIRPRYLPAFPPVSNFDEINIRTYVKSGGKTGVYFLSIEGGNNLSCLVAKGISGLPYRFSKISRSTNRYASTNHTFTDQFEATFSIGNKLNGKNPLDKWLIERYALYQDSETSINAFEIHHLEWPMSELKVENLQLNYPRYQKLIREKPDMVHYSEGVKVFAWGKTEVPRNT